MQNIHAKNISSLWDHWNDVAEISLAYRCIVVQQIRHEREREVGIERQMQFTIKDEEKRVGSRPRCGLTGPALNRNGCSWPWHQPVQEEPIALAFDWFFEELFQLEQLVRGRKLIGLIASSSGFRIALTLKTFYSLFCQMNWTGHCLDGSNVSQILRNNPSQLAALPDRTSQIDSIIHPIPFSWNEMDDGISAWMRVRQTSC